MEYIFKKEKNNAFSKVLFDDDSFLTYTWFLIKNNWDIPNYLIRGQSHLEHSQDGHDVFKHY